jgi:hypothetical protein
VTQADRPWWATDGDVVDGPDEDPVDAHRAARRGEAPEDEAAADGPSRDDGTWWVPATEAMTRLARDLAGAAAERAAGTGGAGAAGAPPGAGTGAGEGGSGASAPGEGGAAPAGTSTAGSAAGGGDGEGPGQVHRIDACGVCPICVGLRAIGDVRPDLVVHLAEAARQLALAVRTVVDAAAPDAEAAGSGAPARGSTRRAGSEEMHRIDLD